METMWFPTDGAVAQFIAPGTVVSGRGGAARVASVLSSRLRLARGASVFVAVDDAVAGMGLLDDMWKRCAPVPRHRRRRLRCRTGRRLHRPGRTVCPRGTGAGGGRRRWWVRDGRREGGRPAAAQLRCRR